LSYGGGKYSAGKGYRGNVFLEEDFWREVLRFWGGWGWMTFSGNFLNGFFKVTT